MDSNRFIQEQYRQKFNSSVFGVILSIGVNLCILLCCTLNSFKYLDPPPEEKSLVISFEEEQAPEIKVKKQGREPSATDANPEKALELVQKSEAQHQGSKQNLAKAATVGPDGDVEVKEPPREEVIDNRALFHSAKNTDKDTLAAQTAREVSDALAAGHARGNAEKANITGAPNARVVGRDVVGTLVRPNYAAQNSGTVVVEIWVDRQGVVTRAVAGAEGTTVTDSQLWTAARGAALKTHFNVDPSAPGLQQGTITYIFKLK